MNMRRKIPKEVIAVLSIILCFFCLMPAGSAYAADKSESIKGKVYEFGEKDHYEYSTMSSFSDAGSENTYGAFSITGDVTPSGMKDGIPSYSVGSGNVALTYSYTDALLSVSEENWHLVEDKTKQVDSIKLDSNIKCGALLLLTSKDGKIWVEDTEHTNVFKENPTQQNSFYTTKEMQLANGCYYRLIVAYKLGVKTGQNKIVFVETDEYDYKKIAEVYEFYLSNQSAEQQGDHTLSKSLGTLTNTGQDNGYSGNKSIGIKDSHYGWEIGQFFVSGYTRATEEKDQTVFLKNVGDQITLWFNLQQDINRLNGNENLSVNADKNGYDQYFQTAKTDMGKGALIIRYTDERGVKHTPEIYTNYLEANATPSADTIVKLFEEGDYEIALDYEIKNTPRKVAGVNIVPEYSNYRVYFSFSVRNGNCMVYPFDISTGAELADKSITANGFKLDMASKVLPFSRTFLI